MANYFIDFEFEYRNPRQHWPKQSRYANTIVSADYENWDFNESETSLQAIYEVLKQGVVKTFTDITDKDQIENLRIRSINKL